MIHFILNNLILYVFFINGITFVIYGIDKWKSKKQKQRISEKALLTLAAIGGIVGAIAGMLVFRHKTAKASFISKIVFIIFIQLILAYFIFRAMENEISSNGF